MKDKRLVFITQAALIAAVYVALTVTLAPISFGEVQFRVSEAMTILPVFTLAAIPGLFIGCLIGNALGGAVIVDVIMGSIATLIGAVGTRMLKDANPYLAPLPPILANVLIVPFVLKYAYQLPFSIPLMMLTVGIGEVLACGVLGMILYFALKKHGEKLFRMQ